MSSPPSSRINQGTTQILFFITSFCALILLANGTYLGTADFIEWSFAVTIQNPIYQYMFALHLLLGGLFTITTPLYLVGHLRRATQYKNSAANRHGKQLITTLAIIIVTGFLLTRGLGLPEIKSQLLRGAIYTLHIMVPLLAMLAYLKHRQRGRNRGYQPGKPLLFMLILFCAAPLLAHIPAHTSPRQGEVKQFPPSLVKTSSDWHLDTFMQDEYCADCHQQSHERWSHSAHRFSSFNNPFYRVSVENLRHKLQQSTGNTEGSRFCAGCHDLVPLMTGEFDRHDFSLDHNPSASAGINCIVCHSISRIDSVRGNADFTLDAPTHYPFAQSSSPALRWFSNLLIKSNPDFHKRTFLKPLHKSAEFCSGCHKVSIPPEVNNYRWLRGQNHYDSFLLSGVSGTSVSSFYYPESAIDRCAQCHMPPLESSEFGAQDNMHNGSRYVHDHLFSAANTALPATLEKDHAATLAAHQQMLKKSARINIVGLRRDGDVNGEFIGPLNGNRVSLQPGQSYLIEVVVRTVGIGHAFTQGTADSNQVWISLEVTANGRLLAGSGLTDMDGQLANNTHLINAYLIDKQGNKINRRNGEDIYTTLYNHQIPPGAADVIHYRFTMPKTGSGPITISATLNYRKFNTDYTRYALNDATASNTLPITAIHHHSITVAPGTPPPKATENDWGALNDYGIGLLRKPNKAQFRQAEQIFQQVAALGREEGRLNLVRLYYQEGRLDEAAEALNQIDYTKLDNPWTATWFAALINQENGYLDQAITLFEKLVTSDWPTARARGFDFSRNYELLNTYATTLMTRAKLEPNNSPESEAFIKHAEQLYQQALVLDPENATAHFGLYRTYTLLGNTTQADYHNQQHLYYKEDDSAHNEAIKLARSKDPYADLTANPVVIYTLTPPDSQP